MSTIIETSGEELEETQSLAKPDMQTGIESLLSPYRTRFEPLLIDTFNQQRKSLAKKLQTKKAHHSLNRFFEACEYSTLGGGKRIRAMLVYLGAKCVKPSLFVTPDSPTLSVVDTTAIAIELIHCYSLIHDDLPSMDDDDLRRGKPTCHIQFGEANAILAGDALQTLAFEMLINCKAASSTQRVALLQKLTSAAGAIGMIGGQVIDLEGVGEEMSLEELIEMHSLKTGALIEAAVELGGLSTCDDPSEISIEKQQALLHYAKDIGLAFQIKDDILDVEGNSTVIGKTQGADIAANKPTFPALLGIDSAKQMANKLTESAIGHLKIFGQSGKELEQLARYIVERNH